VNARILIVLVTLVPSLAFAHPGHGETQPDTWRHFVTEPVHVLSLAIAIVAITALFMIWWRRRDSSGRTGR
jgi:putative copper export protein